MLGLPASLASLLGALAFDDANAFPDAPHTLAWLFIIVGILLLLWEVTMPGFFIAVPAMVLVFMGLVGFAFPDLLLTVYSPVLALAIAIPSTFGTLWFYKRIAPASEAPMTTVGDSLRGLEGQVTVAVQPDTTKGKVKIRGQIWSATSSAPIPAGSRVRVVHSEGVHVVVESVAPSPPSS